MKLGWITTALAATSAATASAGKSKDENSKHKHTDSCDPASVYLFQNHKESHVSFKDSAAPMLSLQQNQLVLADISGTSKYHKYDNEQDAKIVSTLVGKKGIFEHDNDKNSVIVVVEGVKPEKGELMGDDTEPSYKIKAAPNAKYFRELFSQIAEDWNDLGEKVKETLAEGFELLTKSDNNNAMMKRELTEHYATSNPYVAQDLTKLESLSGNLYDGDLAMIHLDSLTKVDEDDYQDAVNSLQKYLTIVATKKDYKVAIVAIPVNSCAFKQLGKRSEEPVKKAEKSVLLTKRSSFGYTSRSECESNTNNCSGHGKCTKLATGNYACSCEPTFDSEKQKTTHWSGSACQKKDISVEFNMFFWTTLVMILVIIYGVKLMISIGDDPLPGVLSAASGVGKRQ